LSGQKNKLDGYFFSLRIYFYFAASNPDPKMCPLVGSYTLRGLITPPYSSSASASSSRHKRNHNSKQHSNHHHPHDLSSLEGASGSSGNGGSRVARKAHTSLSFRNEEDSLKSWHLNDHNKSLRQRRSANGEQSSESDSENSIASPASGAFIDVLDDGSEVSAIDENDQVIKLVRSKRNTSSGMIEMASDAGTDPTRSRRDATINCGNVNTKARQLNIGCSDENKIDISPQCDDEEGKGMSRGLMDLSILYWLSRDGNL
jgi:hypothetical protein